LNRDVEDSSSKKHSIEIIEIDFTTEDEDIGFSDSIEKNEDLTDLVERGEEEKIVNLYKASVAFRITLIGMLLGSSSQRKVGKKLGQSDENLISPIKKGSYWYKLSQHKYNIPGLLQEWQEQQASTVTFKKSDQKFTIVPPMEATLSA
jgi:hypothetical protein